MHEPFTWVIDLQRSINLCRYKFLLSTPQKSREVAARSEQDRIRWVNTINKAIINYRNRYKKNTTQAPPKMPPKIPQPQQKPMEKKPSGSKELYEKFLLMQQQTAQMMQMKQQVWFSRIFVLAWANFTFSLEYNYDVRLMYFSVGANAKAKNAKPADAEKSK